MLALHSKNRLAQLSELDCLMIPFHQEYKTKMNYAGPKIGYTTFKHNEQNVQQRGARAREKFELKVVSGAFLSHFTGHKPHIFLNI